MILYDLICKNSWKMSLSLTLRKLQFWIYWHFAIPIPLSRNCQTALTCTSWFLTSFWKHLLGFFSHQIHKSLSFQTTAQELIYSKNSPFLISLFSFLWLTVTCLSFTRLSSLQGQSDCHGMSVLYPMNLKVPCPANAVVYLCGYHHRFDPALHHWT